jgi:hypothetical protein
MRLHPEVTRDEAAAWLLQTAMSSFGVADSAELRAAIAPLAEAMAAISAVPLSDTDEPEFP